MKRLWCWRCRQEMPMLDEEEYAQASKLYRECIQGAKEFRNRQGIPLDVANIDERFRPLRDWYAMLSGGLDCHQNAIMHHRLSNFGDPCPVCGKPLRSQRARMCAACGATV